MHKLYILGLLAASFAAAAPIGPGQYYTDVAGGGLGTEPAGYFRNDDAVFGPYNLGFSLTYFGQSYSTFWISNNGNIQFCTTPNCAEGDFTPTATLDAQTLNPMIAPYWADIDTRPLNGGNVYLRTDPNQIVVTWDQVGYFANHTDKLASLQLVVRGPDFVVPSDEGRIGFFYKAVQWETGDASGGSGGFGGTPASAGFGDGSSTVVPGEVSIPGSRQNGISSVVTNQHYWFQLGEGGVPQPPPLPPSSEIPEPSTMSLLVAGGLGFGALRAYRSRAGSV